MGDDLKTNLPASTKPTRYCRKCSYALCALTTPRCPECGRQFDYSNPRTTRKRPRWLIPWFIRYPAWILAAVTLLTATLWTTLYLDWRTEQRALATLAPDDVTTSPRLPRWLDTPDHTFAAWLRKHAGPAGFVLDRITNVSIIHWAPDKDVFAVHDLTRLVSLAIMDRKVHDASFLTGLNDLEHLWFRGCGLESLETISRLNHLQWLGLEDNGWALHLDFSLLRRLPQLEGLQLQAIEFADCSLLGGLTHLKSLVLDRVSPRDINALSQLSNLEVLRIGRMRISDLSPLYSIKTLKEFDYDSSITDQQADALHRALPKCAVSWYLRS